MTQTPALQQEQLRSFPGIGAFFRDFLGRQYPNVVNDDLVDTKSLAKNITGNAFKHPISEPKDSHQDSWQLVPRLGHSKAGAWTESGAA